MERPKLEDFKGDKAAFEKADTAWLDAQKSNNKEYKEPDSVKIEGVLKNVSNAIKSRSSDSYFRFLTVDGETNQILIAESLYQSNKAVLSVGKKLEITAEKRVANVTGYKDAADKVQVHTASGLGFTSCSLTADQASADAASTSKSDGRISTYEKALDKITSSISGADKDDKMALATALQGQVVFQI